MLLKLRIDYCSGQRAGQPRRGRDFLPPLFFLATLLLLSLLGPLRVRVHVLVLAAYMRANLTVCRRRTVFSLRPVAVIGAIDRGDIFSFSLSRSFLLPIRIHDTCSTTSK
jgi:hypothetical protein